MTFLKKIYQFIIVNKQARRVVPNIIALSVALYFYQQEHHKFLLMLCIFFGIFVFLDAIVLMFSFVKKAFYTEMIIGNHENIYFGDSVMFTSKKDFKNKIVRRRPNTVRHPRFGYKEETKYKKNINLFNFLLHNIIVKIGFLFAVGLVYNTMYHTDIDHKPLDLVGFYAILTIFSLGIIGRILEAFFNIKTILSTKKEKNKLKQFFRVNSDNNVEKILYEGEILGVKTKDVTVFNLQVFKHGVLTKIAYHEFTDFLDGNSINFDDVTSEHIETLEMIQYN